MLDEQRPSLLRYDLALLGAALSWGINVPLTKLALREIDPLAFNALRFPLSVLCVGLLALREPRQAQPGNQVGLSAFGLWWRVALLGLGGHFVYQVTFVSGIDHTTAGNTALLISTSPIWVALLANVLGLERLSRGAWVGLGTAFVGASLIAMAKPAVEVGGLEGSLWVGNVLVVFSACMWAMYTVGSKPLLRHIAPLALAFRSMAVAVLPMVLVAVPQLLTTDWAGLTWVVWLGVAFSGVFSSGLAYAMWNVGIRHVGPSHTAVFTNLVPVLTLILGFFWLGEVPVPLQLFGGGLVLLGLIFMRVSRPDQREKAKPAADNVGD